MTELTYRPVKHRHVAFLKKAGKRHGFKAAYDALAIEYAVANEMLTTCVRNYRSISVVALHGRDA